MAPVKNDAATTEAPATTAPAPGAPATDAKPGKDTKQVSATISKELYTELSEIRWAVKADKFSDVVAQALSEFAAKHGTPKA